MNHTLYDEPEETDEIEPYDIDSSVSELHAYATKFGKMTRPSNNRSNNIVKMSSDQWYSLDEKSRAIWDQLDNNAKSLILGYTSPSPLSRPQLNRSNGPSKTSSFGKQPFKPQAHLDAISAYDFLVANMHNVTYHDEEIVNDTDNTQDDEPKDEEHDTRLINAMTSSNRTKLPHGDIRRVMSKGSTRLAISLEYCGSSHRTSYSSKYYLADRVANGGVAGDDVRVVFKTH